MKDKTTESMMRIDKNLIKEIKSLKLVEQESLQNVVKRLIEKERRLKK